METVKIEDADKKETQAEKPEGKETQIEETQAEESEKKETQTQESEKKETQIVEIPTQETQAQETQITEPETEKIEITEPGTEETQIQETQIQETQITEPETQETIESETDNAAAEGNTQEVIKYEVTVFKEGQGKIEINQEETLTASVEEGKSVEIIMTPDDSYRVGDILIDNSSVIQNPVQDISYTENDDNTLKLVIENINAAINITVKFENIPADESKTIDDLLHISESAEAEKGRLIS